VPTLKRILLVGLFTLGAVALLLVAMTVVFCVQTRFNQTQGRRATAPATGQFVTAADTNLYVQRVGDRSSPTVVFIHGTGSWSESWRPSMEQVTGLGFQAISIDLPPFGYSVPPDSGDYTKPAQARRILAALDALGVGEAVFVGHSFGAGPLMEAVLLAPQRVRAVVLVDAALGLERAPAQGSTPLQSLLRLRWLSEPLAAAYLTNPVFTKFLLQSFITEKERATDAWVDLYRRPLYLQGTYEGVASWLPELFAGRGLAASDDPATFAKLSVPVTLIWGETDTITPLSQGQYIERLIPGSVLLRIPQAGHIPQIEEPTAFREALARALAIR
jgi:pimeloyl-ACP methyl ester carboxylesterase